jgi:O-antigen/teichoic acid export membrane protein
MIKLRALDPLIKGSAIVMIGSLLGSALNYFFHFVVGRMLSPSDYGILMSLFSILYIVGVPGGILGTTATKFASQYKARGDFKAVTAALFWVEKLVAILGVALLILAIVFRGWLAEFLRIPDPWLPAVFFVFIGLSFLGSAPLGFLRGLSRFKAFSFLSVWGSFLRVFLAAGLAFLGFGIWGVVGGLIINNFLALLTSFALLFKNLRRSFTPSSFSSAELSRYALPTAVVLLALTLLYNTDVILVKHFFSPREAGIYSSVVTMGRIIFFGLSSVVLVAFPLASEKHEGGEDTFKIFRLSVLLVAVGALVGALIYSLFPRILVRLFFGSGYLGAAPYLGRFAIFMGLYALVDFVSRFSLSVRDFRPAVILMVFALLQILAIGFFHRSLSQIVFINILVMIGVLTALGLGYRRFLAV